MPQRSPSTVGLAPILGAFAFLLLVGSRTRAEDSALVDCSASATQRRAPEVYLTSYLEARQAEIAARRAVEASTARFDELAARSLRTAGTLLKTRADEAEHERRAEAGAAARAALCRAAVLERLSALDRTRLAPPSAYLGRWRTSFVGPSSVVVGVLEIAAGASPTELAATFSLRPEQAVGAPIAETAFGSAFGTAAETLPLAWDEGRLRSRAAIRGWRFDGGLDPATGMLDGELSVPSAIVGETIEGTWTAERLPAKDDIEEENIEPE